MSSETSLRSLATRDVRPVEALEWEAFDRRGLHSYAWTATDIAISMRGRSVHTVAADCHETPYGWVVSHRQSSGVVQLMRLAVHPAWWGHGIGRQLLGPFVKMARNDTDVTIVCRVPFPLLPSAGHFLFKCGFRAVEFVRGDGPEELCVMHYTTMRRAYPQYQGRLRRK